MNKYFYKILLVSTQLNKCQNTHFNLLTSIRNHSTTTTTTE